MSNFAIEGLISGFNTTELINAMLDIQIRGPVEQFERRISRETGRLTGFQTLNANLLSLSISAGTLRSPTLFSGKEAKSSDSSAVSVSANSTAAKGSFSISVQNLAKADQVSSNFFTDSTEELGENGKFIINGRTITVAASDTLASIAGKITSANVGAKASVVQTAPNQNKLIINSTSTGVNRLEMREVGGGNILRNLGLIDTSQNKFDYTVSASNNGALSNLFNTGHTFNFTNQTFNVTDGGGHSNVSVTLDGAMTLQDVADAINTANTSQDGKISASISYESGKERLLLSSATGIPSQFVDNDNALFTLGVLTGIQSEEFNSTSQKISDLLSLGDTTPGTFTLRAGDGTGEITVAVDFKNDSLKGIADKINAAAAGSPPSTVSARVISAGNIHRLEITSASGHAQVVADPNNILNTLGLADYNFKHYDQQGENAQFTFNGVTVNRTSNLVSDLVDGVSIALLKENTGTIGIAVNEDYSSVTNVVDEFVSAYNKYSATLGEWTLFDPQGGKHGVLFGNSTVRELRNSLSSMLSITVPNLPRVKLSELNEGRGVDIGKFKITDRSGNSATIDVSGSSTIQDILDEINLQTSAKVKAQISTNGQSINLVDSSGGVGRFKIEEVDGGTTAKDLGLLADNFSNNIAGGIIYEGGSTSLDAIGISLTTGGTLSFDKNKLETALNNDPDLVKNLMQASQVGFAQKFSQTLSRYTAFGTGAIDSASKEITNRIEGYTKQIKKINDRASVFEKTLRRRFSALEVTLSQSQNLSQFLSQRMNNNSNNR